MRYSTCIMYGQICVSHTTPGAKTNIVRLCQEGVSNYKNKIDDIAECQLTLHAHKNTKWWRGSVQKHRIHDFNLIVRIMHSETVNLQTENDYPKSIMKRNSKTNLLITLYDSNSKIFSNFRKFARIWKDLAISYFISSRKSKRESFIPKNCFS